MGREEGERTTTTRKRRLEFSSKRELHLLGFQKLALASAVLWLPLLFALRRPRSPSSCFFVRLSPPPSPPPSLSFVLLCPLLRPPSLRPPSLRPLLAPQRASEGACMLLLYGTSSLRPPLRPPLRSSSFVLRPSFSPLSLVLGLLLFLPSRLYTSSSSTSTSTATSTFLDLLS